MFSTLLTLYYNALSNEEKLKHADILTIFAQSNGNATLILENMITRGANTNDGLWIDRFAEITYDDQVMFGSTDENGCCNLA